MFNLPKAVTLDTLAAKFHGVVTSTIDEFCESLEPKWRQIGLQLGGWKIDTAGQRLECFSPLKSIDLPIFRAWNEIWVRL